MRRYLLVVAGMAALAIAGCSGAQANPSPTNSTTTRPPAPSPTQVACADLAKAGTIIPANLATTGCRQSDGGTLIVGSFACKDGSVLFSGSGFWGLAGRAVHVVTGDVAADPGYAQAYHTCTG